MYKDALYTQVQMEGIPPGAKKKIWRKYCTHIDETAEGFWRTILRQLRESKRAKVPAPKGRVYTAGDIALPDFKRGAVLLHVRREPGQTEAQAAIVFLGPPSAVHSVIGLPKVQQTAVCRSGVWRCRECGCGGADIRQNGLSPGREVRDRRRRGSRETNGAEAVPVHYLGKTSRRASKGGERESGAENVVIATEGDPRITPG
ncbi:hypothetical protein MTO96_001840 [Rhipicephalus appendiculatus]